jgi:hypothetical protein
MYSLDLKTKFARATLRHHLRGGSLRRLPAAKYNVCLHGLRLDSWGFPAGIAWIPVGFATSEVPIKGFFPPFGRVLGIPGFCKSATVEHLHFRGGNEGI